MTEENECPICKKNMSSINYCVTECNHNYCLLCLIEHLKVNNNCPLCREKILEEPLYDSSSELTSDASSININGNIELGIPVNHYEFYGKISLNKNLKHLFILLFILFQTHIIYIASII